MEHWLPLFEERLATLFDHLGDDDVIVRDAGADKALEARREAIDDYFANRERAMEAQPGSYRPLAPERALSADRGMGRGGRRAADPPRHRLPRARERPRRSTSRSSRRAISRPSARRTPMSTKPSSSMSASCGKDRQQGRPRQLQRAAPASGSPACSRTMASSR